MNLVVFLLSLILLVWMTGLPWDILGCVTASPSRELIADAAETVINAHWFDGVFYIPNCDKITPGMILAAMRTNVPAVFCSGGPMKGGVDMTGHQATLSSLFEAVGTYQSGDMSKEELDYLEKMPVQLVVHVQECLLLTQ